MHRNRVYRRVTGEGTETLTVVAYVDEQGRDDEIRVTRTLGAEVVDDGIAFHGRDGERWLRERQEGWTADGFTLVSSGPDY